MSETVARFWNAIRDRDVERAFAEVDEGAVADIAPAGVSGGKAEARAFFDETATAFPDLLLTEKSSFTGSDGTVVTQLKMEGTQAADYLGGSTRRNTWTWTRRGCWAPATAASPPSKGSGIRTSSTGGWP